MQKPFSVLINNSSDAVSYMVNEIAHICRDMKKRAPGTEGEREAAEYMAEVLRNDCGCDEVTIESFKEHPDVFWGYFYFSMTFDVLCALTFFISPALSILFGGLALFIFVFHFLMYRQILDPLFPEKTGTNVTAVRRCTGEVKRRVFLNGHIDAAWEFPLNYRFGGIVFEIPGVMALIGVLFYISISIISLTSGPAWTGTAAKFGLFFMPFFILVAKTYEPKTIVDGANDNLTGCYMGISLLRQMEKHGITLENTELGVILTGSEEAGLKGAKAWCKTHKDDYKDVPTYIVCFDTIHDPRYLMVNERDLNGTVKADPELSRVFFNAAEHVKVPCRRGWVPPFGGSTDSAAFTQGGFRSVGITGLNHVLEDYYHTRKDTPDNLDIQGIDNCYKATVAMISIMGGS